MRFKIDPSSNVPIYLQIVQQVKMGIALGKLAPGEQLPSVRELAVRAVINPNTVHKAYRQLITEGLLHGRKGLGVFVADRRPTPGAHEMKRQAGSQMDALISECVVLGLSPSEIRDLLAERLREFSKRGPGK